jgi:ethanolamine ammonia-lyase large subunit
LRSGDILAGVAAQSGEERVAAQFALADLPLCALLEDHLISYESDEITRLIVDMHDAKAFGFRDWLLSDDTTQDVLEDVGPGGAQVRRHDWRARVHRLLQSNVEVRGCRAADKCDELAASGSTLHSMPRKGNL